MIKYLAMLLVVFFSLSVSPCYASSDIMSNTQKTEYAQNQKDIFNQIKTSIEDTSKKIQSAALKIFYTVGLLGVILIGMRFVFSDSNIQAFFAEVVKYTLLMGILKFTIENADNIVTIIESFALNTLDNSKAVNTEDMLINRLLDTILMVATKVEAAGWIDAIIYTLLGAIIVCLVTVILINFIIILVKMYLVVHVGIIAVALAGCSLTNKYALNYMRECISYALQLLSILAICMVLDSIMENQFTAHTGKDASEILSTITDYFVTIAIIAIFAALSISVPNAIGNLVDSNGSSNLTPIAAAAASYKAAKWALGKKDDNARNNPNAASNVSKAVATLADSVKPSVTDIKTGLSGTTQAATSEQFTESPSGGNEAKANSEGQSGVKNESTTKESPKSANSSASDHKGQANSNSASTQNATKASSDTASQAANSNTETNDTSSSSDASSANQASATTQSSESSATTDSVNSNSASAEPKSPDAQTASTESTSTSSTDTNTANTETSTKTDNKEKQSEKHNL